MGISPAVAEVTTRLLKEKTEIASRAIGSQIATAASVPDTQRLYSAMASPLHRSTGKHSRAPTTKNIASGMVCVAIVPVCVFSLLVHMLRSVDNGLHAGRHT